MTDETKTEERQIATIRETTGGGMLVPQSFREVMDFAQMMARAHIGIPKHLRDDPGACMAVSMQALRWEMDPFSVASKSYNVNGVIAYEAQLLAAVSIARAPIKSRPKYEFDGEGETLTCKVTVEMRNGDVLDYQSPPMGSITIKNSPLWKTDPEQQLGYYSIRSWARRHAPDAILGVYTPEEAHTIEGDFREVDPSDPLEDGEGEETPFEEIEDEGTPEDGQGDEQKGDANEGNSQGDGIPSDGNVGTDRPVGPEDSETPSADATDDAQGGETDSGDQTTGEDETAPDDAPEDEPKPIRTASDAIRWTNRQLSKATSPEEALALFNSGGAKELGQKFGEQTNLVIKGLVATYRDFLKEGKGRMDENTFATRTEGLLEIGDQIEKIDEQGFKIMMGEVGLTI